MGMAAPLYAKLNKASLVLTLQPLTLLTVLQVTMYLTNALLLKVTVPFLAISVL